MTPNLKTPAYVIDRCALERNLAVLGDIKKRTECRILLALKAFSMYRVFPLLRTELDGVCASSPHEAHLGRECFGGLVHAHAAAFSDADISDLTQTCDAIVFNTFDQWRRHQRRVLTAKRPIACGLRINPEHSEGATPLYDPCAPGSRLGIRRADFDGQSLDGIEGLHFHTLCEQHADALERTLKAVERGFRPWLAGLKWINFGGGHLITHPDYDRDRLCRLITDFKRRFGLQVYLEPGEAVALNAGVLAATVLAIVPHDPAVAILDTSCTCHMPDVLEMPYRPRVFRTPNWQGTAEPPTHADCGAEPGHKPHRYRLAGPSCLAGDVVGDYAFDTPLTVGEQLYFEDMAHYTMVKNTTFNGIQLPDIVLSHPDSQTHEIVRQFGYADFKSRLS